MTGRSFRDLSPNQARVFLFHSPLLTESVQHVSRGGLDFVCDVPTPARSWTPALTVIAVLALLFLR